MFKNAKQFNRVIKNLSLGCRRASMQRSFEYSDNVSNKFWNVIICPNPNGHGFEVSTHWGKIGTNGQKKIITTVSDILYAKEYANSLVDAKIAKGYKEVGKLGRPVGSKNKSFTLPSTVFEYNCFLGVLKNKISYPKQSDFIWIDWSIDVGAPITNFLSFKDIKKYEKEEYGITKKRKKLYSATKNKEIEALIANNKAGPNGECLTWEQIIELYTDKG
jgi:predicted DNA-binding WGR domain protein